MILHIMIIIIMMVMSSLANYNLRIVSASMSSEPWTVYFDVSANVFNCVCPLSKYVKWTTELNCHNQSMYTNLVFSVKHLTAFERLAFTFNAERFECDTRVFEMLKMLNLNVCTCSLHIQLSSASTDLIKWVCGEEYAREMSLCFN